MKKKLFSILLFLAMIFGFHQGVAADQAIQADISSDGQDQLSVTLHNQSNGDMSHVNYQLNLPQGYQLDGKLPEKSLLKAGQSHRFTVRVKQNKTGILPKTGEKFLLFSVAGLALLAAGLFLWKYSASRKIFLTLLLLAGSVVGTVLVSANTLLGSRLEFSQSVRLFNQDIPVHLAVYYQAETEDDSQASSSSSSAPAQSSAQEQKSDDSSAPASSVSQSGSSVSSSPSANLSASTSASSSSSPSATDQASSYPVTSSDASSASSDSSLSVPSTDSGITPTVSSSDQPVVDTTPSSSAVTVPVTDNGSATTDTASSSTPVTDSNTDTGNADASAGTVVPSTDNGASLAPDVNTVATDAGSSSDSGSLPTLSVDSGNQATVSTGDSSTVNPGATASDAGNPVLDPDTSASNAGDSGASTPEPKTDTETGNSASTATDPTVPSTDGGKEDKPSADSNQPSSDDKPSSDKRDENTSSDNASDKESSQEILVSGYALSNLTGRGMEFGEVSLRENGKEIQTFETDSDGYFYVHLTKGKTYTLHGQDFEASITANGNNDFQVHNILGQFSLGRNNSDSQGKVVLNPSVVQLDIVDYQVDEAAHQVIFPEEKKLNLGDIIVLPASGSYPTGFAFKVLSSKIVDGKTILTVTNASLEEVAKEIDVQTEFDFSEGTVVLAEGTTMVEGEEDSLGNRASISAEAAARRVWKKKIGGVDVAFKITGKVESKLNWSFGQSPHVYVRPSLNFNLTTDFTKEASFSGKKKLLTVHFTTYYGTTITTDIYVFVDAKGKFNISTESDLDLAAELGVKDGEAYFEQQVQLENELDLNMSGQVKVGPLAVFKPGFLNLSAVSFDVAVGLGLDGAFNAKVSQKNLQAPKLEEASGHVTLFGDLTMGYEVGFANLKLKGKFLKNERFFEHPLAEGTYKPNSGKRKLKDAKPMTEEDYRSVGDDTSSSSNDNEDGESTTGYRGLEPTRPITNIKIGELLFDINKYPWIKWEVANGPLLNPYTPEGYIIETAHFLASEAEYYTLYDANKDGEPEVYYLGNGKITGVVVAPVEGVDLIGYRNVKILDNGTIRAYKTRSSYNEGEFSRTIIDYDIYHVSSQGWRKKITDYEGRTTSSRFYKDWWENGPSFTFSELERLYLTAPEVDWESLPWQPFVRREDWLSDPEVTAFNTYGAI